MTKHSLDDSIMVETDLFEHREVKPHFINACCFGEDFAAWLKEEIATLTRSRFTFSEIIQEDYGWGFWVSHGKTPFWVAVGPFESDAQSDPFRWVIFVVYDPGLNLIKRLFHKPDARVFAQLRDKVWNALKSNSAIKVIGSLN
jgi:hypothetical protein